MLIALTRRKGANPPAPVLVGTEQILYVEPAGGTGSSVFLAGGTRLDVAEDPDLVLDAIDGVHDDGWRKKAAAERKKARDERLAAEAKAKADAEAAVAKAKADAAHEEAERHRAVAEGAARRAADAAKAASVHATPEPLAAAEPSHHHPSGKAGTHHAAAPAPHTTTKKG